MNHFPTLRTWPEAQKPFSDCKRVRKVSSGCSAQSTVVPAMPPEISALECAVVAWLERSEANKTLWEGLIESIMYNVDDVSCVLAR